MPSPEATGRALRAGLLIALLVGAAVAVQLVVRPDPVEAPPEVVAPVDSEASMDLEHLRPEDVAFLTKILEGSDVAASRSATKALLISGDLRGVRPLFAAAEHSGDIYCEAALEILRLQTPADAWRELAQAPAVCGADERLVAVEAALSDDDVASLIEDPDPAARQLARERLAR